MGEEHGDLVERRHAPLFRLAAGRWHADDDVTENGPGQLPELALSHREGQHIGRAILSTIVTIKNFYLIIPS